MTSELKNGVAVPALMQKPGNHLTVVDRQVDRLNPNPLNPRRHSNKQIRQIAASIRQFGFRVPILIDSHGRIIVGHGRWLAARKLGLTTIPTITIEGLNEAQLQVFAITDNRLVDNSTWDDRLLAEVFKQLAAIELDFSLELTGFDMAEIDLRIQSLDCTIDEAGDPADAPPPSVAGPPITQIGDLWRLDRHRVFCGDSTKSSTYRSLMDGRQAGMGFGDPPYNDRIAGHVTGLGRHKHREFAMASGEMSDAEYISFLSRFAELMARHSLPGSVQYLCIDWRHVEHLIVASHSAFAELINICVWVKHVGGMGSLYRSQHELICVFRNGRARHRNNVQLGRYGRNRTNVWNYPGINNFGRAGEEGNLAAQHPTVKPVALVADAILDCSARGDVILDPFLGSGTTVMAAERTGRNCYGIEIDPLYVDSVIRRWQSYTGDTARLAATGQSFNELSAIRGGRNAE